MTIFGPRTTNFESAPDCLCEGDETKGTPAHGIGPARLAIPAIVRPRKEARNTVSSITSKSSKATALAQVQAVIAATEKPFSKTTFVLRKTADTAATLTPPLQSLAHATVRLNALPP